MKKKKKRPLMQDIFPEKEPVNKNNQNELDSTVSFEVS